MVGGGLVRLVMASPQASTHAARRLVWSFPRVVRALWLFATIV